MARNLRSLLLAYLAPAMLGLALAGGGIAYVVAHEAATRAYDRALLDAALALAAQIQWQDDAVLLHLTPQSHEILLTDKYDRIFYEVIGPDGASVAGHRDLPRPRPPFSESGRFYYDGWYLGEPVRIAALKIAHEGKTALVLAAETVSKRERMEQEILLGMLLPELVLVIAAVSIVWLAIRHGLQPLDKLRGEISHRSYHDLRPVATSSLPNEIRPVAEEINHLLERLQESLAAQRHFVSDAAHQLRTPIAALLAQTEAAMSSTSPASPDQIGRILGAARRISHLANQLLALARAEPGGVIAPEPVDLAELIRAGAEDWLPAAVAKDIELAFELELATVEGVPLLLREMLANLVDNAIRYTPVGGAVVLRCGKRDGAAFVEVEDSGPGIPAGEREKIFERFHRLPNATEEGCGLGLSIVREICRQHGAEVSAGDAPVLSGTLFTVRFRAG